MTYFWITLITVSIVLVIGFRVHRSLKTARANMALYAAKDWFADNDIDAETVAFKSYEGAGLTRHEEALIIVGVGKNNQAESVGFVLEVTKDDGVVAGEVLSHPAVASPEHHVAKPARAAGMTILDFLVQQAAKVRDRAPDSN